MEEHQKLRYKYMTIGNFFLKQKCARQFYFEGKKGNFKNGYNESRVVFCRIISVGYPYHQNFQGFFLLKCRGKIHLFLSPLKLYEQWSVNLFKINSSFLLNFYYCNIIVQNHRYRMPRTQRKKMRSSATGLVIWLLGIRVKPTLGAVHKLCRL